MIVNISFWQIVQHRATLTSIPSATYHST